MVVTKDMYDEELQAHYWSGRLLAWLLSKEWGVYLLSFGDGFSKGAKIKGVHNQERYIPSKSESSDHKIRVRIFRRENSKGKIPAVLYLHGGGYFLGNPELSLKFYEDVLNRRDVAIIAPAYRLSIKHPYPAGFNDCYDTLLWMKENADELNIRQDKFIVAGHSAGGGLTAAVTLKARDTGDCKIAFQMPFYPGIDHRMITESSQNMQGAAVLDTAAKKHGWAQYLKGLFAQGLEVPTYASAALNENYTDFPPTISFIGDLEPMKDETIAYMESLKRAGIPTKFRLFKGAFHGFDDIAPETKIAKEAIAYELEAFEEYFDLYMK